ncbi:MAG: hypothetical protein MR979_06395 [Mollicutes bacterium]|nr:hypothetical protein [Mollicutes bacterium]
MVEKKIKVIISSITFALIGISMGLLLAYSCLRLVTLFSSPKSVSNEFATLHFTAGVFGIIVSILGLVLSIYYFSLSIKGHKDDKNIYNWYAAIFAVFYFYKSVTIFFYVYALVIHNKPFDLVSIAIPILFILSFIYSILVLVFNKIYLKKVFSILHSSLSFLAFFTLIFYEKNGFPLVISVFFAIVNLATFISSLLGLPCLRMRLSKNSKNKIIDLENSYDKKEIDEQTLCLESIRVLLKEK